MQFSYDCITQREHADPAKQTLPISFKYIKYRPDGSAKFNNKVRKMQIRLDISRLLIDNLSRKLSQTAAANLRKPAYFKTVSSLVFLSITCFFLHFFLSIKTKTNNRRSIQANVAKNMTKGYIYTIYLMLPRGKDSYILYDFKYIRSTLFA